jgi:hypothetical protein
MILETIPALGQLTCDQKLRLVCELWRDVSRDPAIDERTAELLDARLAEYEAQPDAVKSTAEVTAGLFSLKQRLTAESR